MTGFCRIKEIVVVVFVFLSIFGNADLHATIYYVNDGSTASDTWCSAVGDDANDGLSVSTPKLTLADVLADYANAAGDIIRIDNGTYSWAQVNMDASGSVGNVITIVGAGQSKTIITCSSGYGFNTADYDYVTVQSLRWNNGNNYVFFISAGSTNVTAYYCTLDCTAANEGYRSIGFYNGCSNCTADQCILSAVKNAVLFYNSSNNTVSNCVVSSVSGTLGLIRIEQTSANNTISDNILTGVAGIQYVIYSTGTCSGTIIKGNRMDGNTCATGIYMAANSTSFSVYNNYFYDMQDGLNSVNLANTGTTCYFNSMYVTVNPLKGYFGSWNIRNNILYTTSNSNGDYCFNNCCAAYYPTTMNYNLYYHPNDARAGWFDGGNYATKADIVAGTAFEDNGLEANPGYPLATVWYLDIDATDPNYLTGLTIAGVSTDIKRNTRPSPPSIGATELGTPLPVKLLYVKAHAVESDVELIWATASEINNSHFEIQRMSHDDNWEVIGYVDGSGNTSSIKNYFFYDKHAQKGNNYYRIRNVDYDGSSELSPLVVVGFEFEGEILAYMNSNNDLMITLPNATGKQAKTLVRLVDMLGKEQWSRVVLFDDATANISVDKSVSTGVYFVNVLTSNGQLYSKKVFVN